MKKRYKVCYYLYNLTEMETKWFYTEFAAAVYGYWICMRYGFRTYVYFE